MSFLDRLKDKVSAAGKEAKKLARLGELKLDLKAAEGDLGERYKALGKACANRIMERGETTLDVTESAMATYVDEIRAAQKRIQALKAELEEVRSQ